MAHLERTCQVRNRVRQSRTLGSVGGGARQRPLLPGRHVRHHIVAPQRIERARKALTIAARMVDTAARLYLVNTVDPT